MRFYLFTLLFAFFVSCGRDGRDGADAPVPDDKPKPDEISETITCNFKWELSGEPAGRFYDLSYVVLKLHSKEVHATLKSTYHTAKDSQAPQSQSVKFPEGKDFSLSTPMWTARLIGKDVLFRNNLLNEERGASCN